MGRIIVVSNRVAVPQKGARPAAGGLAVAVDAALRDRGGIWFGWSGRIAPEPAAEPEPWAQPEPWTQPEPVAQSEPTGQDTPVPDEFDQPVAVSEVPDADPTLTQPDVVETEVVEAELVDQGDAEPEEPADDGVAEANRCIS